MVDLYSPSDHTRERPVGEAPPHRSDFRRDYARVLHSPAFRRLQGKTQLFPGIESDFFRNRLTHSLEVAQIAKAIASRLNCHNEYFEKNPIDLDLVEMAALAHDLGHPPFGHNGERALDDCMKKRGGFEGNAQSLRILARLEKKEQAPSGSQDLGLNLTHRSLAAVIKYDQSIPTKRKAKDHLVKGYYDSEKDLVNKIKNSVNRNGIGNDPFKTVECQIMDLADDIAYSTYDLEDALKAGFVTPIGTVLGLFDNRIMEPLKKKLKRCENDIIDQVMDIWLDRVFDLKSFNIEAEKIDLTDRKQLATITAYINQQSEKYRESGMVRVNFTSELVGECIDGAYVSKINDQAPALSKIDLKMELKSRVELLKQLTYEMVIKSPELKTVEYRGYDIVKSIFKSLSKSSGELLLPDDHRQRVVEASDELERDRAICDFVAGMTDRYAIEFYGRLQSEAAQTIFKPV